MSEWRNLTLDELGSVERGKSRHRPRNDPRLFGGDTPFFQTGDVKAATLHLTKATQFLSEFGVAQSRVWKPGITCITIAANIAETAILALPGCFPDSVLGFTPAHQPSDAYFVKYLLDVHRAQLTSSARGTTQDNLSLEKLLTHQFSVPDRLTRARIAGVLVALDCLIEKYQLRAAVLEDAAQAIHRQWFVNFRCVGDGEAVSDDSPIGRIPEGWEVLPLAELGQFTVGGDWGSDAPGEGLWSEVVCLRGVDLPRLNVGDSKGCRKRWVKDSSLARRRLEPGDVVIEASGECGRALAYRPAVGSLVDKPLVYSNFCKRFRCYDPIYSRLVARTLNTMVGDGSMASFKTGTAIPNLNAVALIENHLVVRPSRMVVEHYNQVIAPIEDFAVAGAANKLASIRDYLLPKLMTGQIDVSSLDLDAVTEASVA